MANLRFQTWRQQHPDIETHLHFPDGEKSGWGRIHARWHEKHDGVDLTHICAFTLDLQTGDIYLDCTKQKIWVKCLFLSVGRPLFGSFKTIYHITLPVSIPIEIFKAVYAGIERKDPAKDILQSAIHRIYHNFEDIIRTPVYTIALTTIALAAVIIGPFIPGKLYELRALASRVENALNRGEESWILAPCFQPIEDIVTITANDYTKDDTEYDQEATLHALNNLARSYVRYRKTHRNLFDNYYRLVKQDEVYISPACYA